MSEREVIVIGGWSGRGNDPRCEMPRDEFTRAAPDIFASLPDQVEARIEFTDRSIHLIEDGVSPTSCLEGRSVVISEGALVRRMGTDGTEYQQIKRPIQVKIDRSRFGEGLTQLLPDLSELLFHLSDGRVVE